MTSLRLPGSILQGILARSALTFLRIYLGLMLLVSAWPKLEPGFGPMLTRQIQLGQSPTWYQQFAEQIIVPRVALVAPLISWGELLVGFCLVLGLGTRLAAAVAFLLCLNFMLAEGSGFWTPTTPYSSWAIMSLALLLGAAGRTLGLDAFVAKRWPRSPFW